MDNLTRQKEEIEVLASIYGNDWKVDNEADGLYHISIEGSGIRVYLLLELPPNYPSESPPSFQLCTPSLRNPDNEDLTNILQDLYLENVGETIIYQWIERIRDWIHSKTEVYFTEEKFAAADKQQRGPEALLCNPGNYATDEEVGRLCAQMQDNAEICDNSALEVEAEEDSPPIYSQPAETPHLHIVHGDPITFKKSTFQGHAAFISDPKDAKFFLKELLENKKVAHATHNIQAYRIVKERNNTFDEHFEDDGEKQAGHRLLHLMQMMNVKNVIVMVSRWYGGVHLGPDRFRLINNAAKEVLEKGNFIPPPEGRKKK